MKLAKKLTASLVIIQPLITSNAYCETGNVTDLQKLLLESPNAQQELSKAFSAMDPEQRKGLCHHLKINNNDREQEIQEDIRKEMEAELLQSIPFANQMPAEERKEIEERIKQTVAQQLPQIVPRVAQTTKGVEELFANNVIECDDIDAINIKDQSESLLSADTIIIDD